MKKIILFICVTLLNSIGVFAQFPTTSTTGNDVWYYIQCMPRTSNLEAKWLTGGTDGTVLTNTVLDATNDAQLWKIVSNGGGISLVNKLSGAYIDSDRPYDAVATSIISCVNATPVTPLKLVSYVDQVAKPNYFYLVNVDATNVTNAANTTLTFQFYSAGAGSSFRPINYGANAPNVNSAIKFMQPKDILLEAITAAEKGYNTTFEGVNPGQYTFETREGLRSVIEAGRTIYEDANSTVADYFSITTEVKSIFALYKSQINMPIESTNTSEIWYLLKSSRPANSYLASQGADALTMANPYVLNDDSQLWKVVKNTTGFALMNKATGQYLNTDMGDVVQVNTQSTLPTTQLSFFVSDEVTINASRFWIKNMAGEANNFLMHTGTDAKIWNWVGGVNDNSTWLFVNPLEAIYMEFNSFVESIKGITSAIYPIGTGEGEFNAEMWNAFLDQRTLAINMVNSESGSEPPTKEQIDDMTLAVNIAIDNLNATRNFPISFSTADNQIYYTIQDRRPTTNYWKVGEKDGQPSRLLVTRELEATNPEYLFRFEKAAGTVDSFLIYCKAYPTIPLSVIGATSDNLIAVDATGTAAVWSVTRTFDKHPSFSNIVFTTAGELTASYHNAMHVGFWTPGEEDFGNDWKFIRSQLSAVTPVSSADLGVYVLNRRIVARDANSKLNIFNLLGQRLNSNLELTRGIYLVQVEGKKGIVKLFVN